MDMFQYMPHGDDIIGTGIQRKQAFRFPHLQIPVFFCLSSCAFVWFEPKQTWIELGGSGVFRPEVTEPLGCKVPVLAWGLGLERLAMLRYNCDIRELYWSDLDWVREVPLCR